MKAYQVFTGDTDKHDNQRYDLVATYLDKELALEHCKKLVDETPLYGEQLIENDFNESNGIKDWDTRGWNITTIVRLKEISITE
jgi:hypothetical protein